MNQPAYAEKPDAYPQLLCQLTDLVPWSGVVARYENHAIALFYLPGHSQPLYGLSNTDPLTGASVIAHGLIGETAGEFYVAAPLHKQQYRLHDGQCLQHSQLKLLTYNVQLQDNQVWLIPT